MSTLEFESPEWDALQTFAQQVCDKAAESHLNQLNEFERVAFLVWIADGEVRNGGMHAICYNSTGDYLPYLPEAFRKIGANRKASLFERLSRVFGDRGPSTDHAIRIQEHASLPESSNDIIDSLDANYYSTNENIDELLFTYLERNGYISIS